jgi:DNA integrity scanning protein DisA with diadenylate cyclase activity
MDARVFKLKHFVDADVAEMLVEAGLDTPRKIKAANDKDIEAIKGIGKAKKDKIRQRIPKHKK